MTLPIRKLERPEESEKKRKRNTLILSVVMIGILLFSTVGYFSLQDNSTDNTSVNGKVQTVGGSWVFQYGDQSIALSNSPESGKNISIIFFSGLDKYYGKTVYISSTNDAEAYEITSTLGRYTQRIQSACYGDCNQNLPEKNCNDNLIVLKGFNETQSYGNGKVYEQGNCTFIEGGLVATDAFLYKIFGVN